MVGGNTGSWSALVYLAVLRQEWKLMKTDYLTSAQVELLMRGTMHAREKLILGLAYYHGLRVTEVMHLRVGDVDGGVLRVHSLKGSHDAKQALMALPEANLPALLRDHLETLEDRAAEAPLFPSAKRVNTKSPFQSRQAAHAMIKRLAKHAGIHHEDAHMHSLRHGMAVAMVEAGEKIDRIQVRMRHKDLSSTGRYFHCTDEQADQAAARVFTRKPRGDSNA